MNRFPSWTKWVSFFIFIIGTCSAMIIWASDAHTENSNGITENRVKLEQNRDDHRRIEEKLDKIMTILLGI